MEDYMELEIEILDYWHAGSGTGMGPLLDSRPVEDEHGLPYLPGRTLRGLVREGLTLAEENGHQQVPRDSVEKLFGKDPTGKDQGAGGGDGLLHFTNAKLEEKLVQWLAGRKDASKLAGTLFRAVAATAMEGDRGVVKDKSLRTNEFAVPVRLFARIYPDETLVNDDSWKKAIKAALPLIRGLGSHRRRGYGRVSIKERQGESDG